MRLGSLYSSSTSQKSFLNLIENSDLPFYKRGGKIVGIQGDKRRYRLKTLGFAFQQEKQVLKRLHTLKKRNGPSRDPELER